MSSDAIRQLIVGSLPPPIGGTTVLLEQLVLNLEKHPDCADLAVVNTTPIHLAQGIGKLFEMIRAIVRILHGLQRADLMSFHASTAGVTTFAPVLRVLCRIRGIPFIVRNFGGSFDVDYLAMSPRKRRLAEFVQRSDIVLYETHRLMEFFSERFPDGRFEWYANSRPSLKLKTPGRDPDGTLRLAFLGHVKATKGIHEILAASDLVSDLQCSIDLYGSLWEDVPPDSFDDHPNVSYKGEIASQEVLTTLSTYDALLLPTYHDGEGYPGVILESYAVGLPVVSTHWRSIPEIVEDGVSGLLIEPRDAAALGEAIRRLHDSPELLDRLRRGAREKAGTFDSELWTNKFIEICESVMKGRRS